MNIDNLMDQLIAQGIDFKSLSKAYDDAADRKQKRDTVAVETARANVMQALRKYTIALYGECDEEIMAEFETTLKGLEVMANSMNKPNTWKVEFKSKDNKSDEETLRRFLEAIARN